MRAKRIWISVVILFSLSHPGKIKAQPTAAPAAGPYERTDTRKRVYLTPVRMVWKSETGTVGGEEFLLRPGTGQSVLGRKQVCVLNSTETGRPALLLDFGREIQGGLQIITGQSSEEKPARVRIRFGESAGEAMAETGGPDGATNDHAMRDLELQLPWLGAAEIGNTGFRFVRIDLLDPDRELLLKEVSAISVYEDIPYVGSFRCNDERLNRIWQTGAYTVHLCLQGYLWDGPKRDRLVWVGDLHPEVMTVNSVFGYNEAIPKSLDLIRDETPLPGWMNGISSYSLWWILIHRDWYFYQGDFAYLRQQRDYLTRLLGMLLEHVGPDGKETLPGNRFLDWPSSPNVRGIDAGLQALLLMTLRAGAELCDRLDERNLARKCRETAGRMAAYVPDPNGLKQAAALMGLADLLPPGEADRQVSRNGAEGFSTFYGYYMLQAQARAGNYQGALDCIRTYWGGMLDLGATTFWEDFDLNWLRNAARIDELATEGQIDVHAAYGDYCYKGYRHSLSHGWASGPTSWLSEHVLGVRVLEPGCRKIRITPHLGDLEWVEGTFPTPYGTVEIRHEKKNGKIVSAVTGPAEVSIVN